MKRGLFLTFEGIDGAGKTTQIGLLGDKLARQGIPSLFVREPGSTLVGEKIRQILLTPENKGMAAATEILLYAAARAQIVTEKIRPALDEGKMVVCDRYIHSSLAYQGFGLGYAQEKIRMINGEATGGLWPDLTFVFDIEVAESSRRIDRKGDGCAGKDRIEQRDSEFYNRVRRGYLALAAGDPKKMIIIPSHLSIEEAHATIWEELKGRVTIGI